MDEVMEIDRKARAKSSKLNQESTVSGDVVILTKPSNGNDGKFESVLEIKSSKRTRKTRSKK
jgi:hypothetical protein